MPSDLISAPNRSDPDWIDVVVVGNVGIDTNIYSPEDPHLNTETSFTKNLDCVGQAGGYAALGFSALKKRTAFIGYVGDDFCGEHIRRQFDARGIDTTCLFVDPAGTCRSVNLMYVDGRRKSFYDGRSHMTLEPDIAKCRDLLSKARLAHFNIPNWARRLLPLARELRLAISCDLQDVPNWADAYRRDFIEYSDVLFFSAVHVKDPAKVIQEYLRMRPGRIIIAGLGSRGCAVGTDEGVTFCNPAELGDPVLDTNGAGDILAATFLCSHILDGYPLSKAIVRAQIAARYKCARRGSSDLMTLEALDDRFGSMP